MGVGVGTEHRPHPPSKAWPGAAGAPTWWALEIGGDFPSGAPGGVGGAAVNAVNGLPENHPLGLAERMLVEAGDELGRVVLRARRRGISL